MAAPRLGLYGPFGATGDEARPVLGILSTAVPPGRPGALEKALGAPFSMNR